MEIPGANLLLATFSQRFGNCSRNVGACQRQANVQNAAVHLEVIRTVVRLKQHLIRDGLFGKLHKGSASRATRDSVLHNFGIKHVTEFVEKFLQIFFFGVEIQVSKREQE